MNIPHSLLKTNKKSNFDVSIIIGANGSGKSTLLNNIALHFRPKKDFEIVAIANALHDKFNLRASNFSVLRGRQGRKQVNLTLKKAIRNIANSGIQRLKFTSLALKHVGFDPQIGFRLPEINVGFLEEIIEDSQILEKEHIGKIQDIIARIERFRQKDKIVWLTLDESTYDSLDKMTLIELFKHEKELVKLKIINPIEVFLSKNGKSITLLNASSGELSFIVSIVFIATVIKENTIILIDEPENSLHPKWQKEYVEKLLDIFYLYSPKLVIATHSPTIVNGAEITTRGVNVYFSQNFELTLADKVSNNIEENYYDLFGLITPQSRYLTNMLTDHLNKLSERSINLDVFLDFISSIKNDIYDEKQLELISGVVELADKIDRMNN